MTAQKRPSEPSPAGLPSVNAFDIGGIRVGEPGRLLLIAGPCVIQDDDLCLRIAEHMRALCSRLDVDYVFKASFDKANRSSLEGFRGPGLEDGLRTLERVRKELDCPVLSDVHGPEQVESAAEVLDVLQVPAFLCRQTDLLVACAQSDCAVNVKKGQFLSPWDMRNVVEKLTGSGCEKVTITERGASFGYNNLVSDMRALPVMRDFGWPVIFDSTHSLQLPGGQGKSTGGQREYIPHLARAAVATGVDGIFAEVHEDPSSSPSDAQNILRLEEIDALLPMLVDIKRLVG